MPDYVNAFPTLIRAAMRTAAVPSPGATPRRGTTNLTRQMIHLRRTEMSNLRRQMRTKR